MIRPGAAETISFSGILS